MLGHQLLERRQQQVLLAAEAAVEGAERDAGVRRHVAQAHRLEAALLGQLDRGLDDASGAFFHAGHWNMFHSSGPVHGRRSGPRSRRPTLW